MFHVKKNHDFIWSFGDFFVTLHTESWTNKNRLRIMTNKLFRVITEFFEENLHTHTDWTGTRVETRFECESVEDFIDMFMNHIKENGAD